MVLADDLSVIVSLFPCHMCCWQYHPDHERLEIKTGDLGLLRSLRMSCILAYRFGSCHYNISMVSLGPNSLLLYLYELNLNSFNIGLMVSNGTCKSQYCGWILTLPLFGWSHFCTALNLYITKLPLENKGVTKTAIPVVLL